MAVALSSSSLLPPVRLRLSPIALFVLGALSVLLGLGLLVFAFVRDAGERTVSEIRVEGNRYLNREEALLLAGVEGRTTITGAERRAARKRLEAHAAVESAQVEVREGGVLVLRLRERPCGCLVRDAASGRLFDVDASGRVLGAGHVRCRGVPILSGAFHPEAGAFEDPRVLDVLAGLRRIRESYPELYARVSEVRPARDGTTDLFLSGSRVRIVIADRLEGEVVHRLFAAVAFLERERMQRGTLDLRGRDAVFSP